MAGFTYLVLKISSVAHVLARQAVKTPPRRLPTVMVRSPIDSASPGGDYPLGDLTPTTMEEATSGVSVFAFIEIDLQRDNSQQRAE